ncbi:MAG: ATP-binding protein, partial [Phycisphaerales bacterium]|nr:ATP-binding protein [Phycisphaerales bacterium]
KARASGASMELVIETDALLGSRVRADRKGLERILVNLVDNACKYASEASDRRVHLEGACDDQTVRLAVRDHGPGVPPGEGTRIFAPFARARSVADSAVRGLGLGLALSRGLALEQGGDLRLVPSDGGARFELSLPRVR